MQRVVESGRAGRTVVEPNDHGPTKTSRPARARDAFDFRWMTRRRVKCTQFRPTPYPVSRYAQYEWTMLQLPLGASSSYPCYFMQSIAGLRKR